MQKGDWRKLIDNVTRVFEGLVLIAPVNIVNMIGRNEA